MLLSLLSSWERLILEVFHWNLLKTWVAEGSVPGPSRWRRLFSSVEQNSTAWMNLGNIEEEKAKAGHWFPKKIHPFYWFFLWFRQISIWKKNRKSLRKAKKYKYLYLLFQSEERARNFVLIQKKASKRDRILILLNKRIFFKLVFFYIE